MNRLLDHVLPAIKSFAEVNNASLATNDGEVNLRLRTGRGILTVQVATGGKVPKQWLEVVALKTSGIEISRVKMDVPENVQEFNMDVLSKALREAI